jgi:hypothetical protein
MVVEVCRIRTRALRIQAIGELEFPIFQVVPVLFLPVGSFENRYILANHREKEGVAPRGPATEELHQVLTNSR